MAAMPIVAEPGVTPRGAPGQVHGGALGCGAWSLPVAILPGRGSP